MNATSEAPAPEYSGSGFCGDKFWDTELLVTSSWPRLTQCFQDTLLVYVPFGCLWLSLPFYVYSLASRGRRPLPISSLTVIKLFLASSLSLLSLVLIIEDASNSSESIHITWSQYVANIIRVVSYAAATLLIYYERKHHITTSGILYVLWTVLVVCDVVPLYSKIMLQEYKYSLVRFTLFVLIYGMEVLQLLLNSVADTAGTEATPATASPEVTASFLSQIFYLWVTRTVYRGWKRDLQEEELFDLNPRDVSDTLVPGFEQLWTVEVANFHRKRRHERMESNIHRMAELSYSRDDYSETEPLLANMNGTAQRNGGISTVGSQAHSNSADKPKPSLLRVLMKMVGGRLVVGLIQKIVSDAFLLVSPVLLSLLISYADEKETDFAWKGYTLAVLLFISQTFKSLLFNFSFWTSQIVGMQLKTTLIAAIYKKALTMNNEAKKESTAGEIVNLMSVDCQRVQDVMNFFFFAWTTPIQVAVAVAVLYQYLGPSIFAGLAVLLLTVPFNSYIASKQQELQVENLRYKDSRLRLTNEALSGIKVLKLYAWEPPFQTKISDIRNMETKFLLRIAYLNILISVCFNAAPYLVALATFAVYVNVSDENHLDANKAFVALSFFNLLKVPLALLATIISMSVQAIVSIGRINAFLCTGDLRPDNIMKDGRAANAIEIENGTFTWDKSAAPTLRNISFKIPEGKLYAVVGHVGSGKSSLMSALLGEMERLSGTASIKNKVAYVPQQAWIQNATVRDNILFGKPYNKKSYRKVLSVCALERDLEILSAGDMTEIGEKGINLSGGQKQRVSLARAVYSNADIYIFDDPLSAVDTHVGKHIFNHVIGHKGVLKGKTRVLVTHGAHWLPMVDSIIVLSGGVITEAGSYEDLMAHNGPFAEFIRTYLLQGEETEDTDPELRAMTVKLWSDAETAATSDGATSGDEAFNKLRHRYLEKLGRRRRQMPTLESLLEMSYSELCSSMEDAEDPFTCSDHILQPLQPPEAASKGSETLLKTNPSLVETDPRAFEFVMPPRVQESKNEFIIDSAQNQGMGSSSLTVVAMVHQPKPCHKILGVGLPTMSPLDEEAELFGTNETIDSPCVHEETSASVDTEEKTTLFTYDLHERDTVAKHASEVVRPTTLCLEADKRHSSLLSSSSSSVSSPTMYSAASSLSPATATISPSMTSSSEYYSLSLSSSSHQPSQKQEDISLPGTAAVKTLDTTSGLQAPVSSLPLKAVQTPGPSASSSSSAPPPRDQKCDIISAPTSTSKQLSELPLPDPSGLQLQCPSVALQEEQLQSPLPPQHGSTPSTEQISEVESELETTLMPHSLTPPSPPPPTPKSHSLSLSSLSSSSATVNPSVSSSSAEQVITPLHTSAATTASYASPLLIYTEKLFRSVPSLASSSSNSPASTPSNQESGDSPELISSKESSETDTKESAPKLEAGISIHQSKFPVSKETSDSEVKKSAPKQLSEGFLDSEMKGNPPNLDVGISSALEISPSSNPELPESKELSESEMAGRMRNLLEETTPRNSIPCEAELSTENACENIERVPGKHSIKLQQTLAAERDSPKPSLDQLDNVAFFSENAHVESSNTLSRRKSQKVQQTSPEIVSQKLPDMESPSASGRSTPTTRKRPSVLPVSIPDPSGGSQNGSQQSSPSPKPGRTVSMSYDTPMTASLLMHSHTVIYEEDDSGEKALGKLTEAERLESGKVKLAVFWVYSKATGTIAILFSFLLFALFQVFSAMSNFWLTDWTEDTYLLNSSLAYTDGYQEREDYYLGIFGLYGVLQIFFLTAHNIIYWIRMVIAAKRLHLAMLVSIFRSPMSFFDTTPLGRIMNRFSRDIEVVDNNLPIIVRDYTSTLFTVIVTLIVISITTPLFLALMVPIMLLYYFIQNFYIPTSRQLKRIESVTRSPIYIHFSETISGGPTIRAYEVTTRFIHESKARVDRNQSFYYISLAANRWLGINLEMLANLIILGSAIFAVVTPGISGGDVGLSVSYAIQVSSNLVWMVRQMSDLETNIVSVERLKEYSELESEAQWIVPHRRPVPGWPMDGKVKFANYMTRYRPGLDLVLKGITCEFKAGEKIGIVGRTGAGKSSLALALFRLIEASSGSITVDGVRLSDVGLHDVRSRLTILPQDPVLFFGTLRMNLDPVDEYDEGRLWEALTSAHLREFVQSLPEGLQYEVGEEGHSLSVGQRQLVCLARALLKKTKILILDEATAAVDMETDTLIQNTIRTEFESCTIITIAHRLNTIMDYDRIMVLDAGQIKELDTPSALLADQQSVFYSMAKEANLV